MKSALAWRRLRAVVVYVVRALVASVGIVSASFILGLWLHRLSDSAAWRLALRLIFEEPYFPFSNLVGLCCGYLVNRRLQSRSAAWVWVLPAIWLACVIADQIRYAYPGQDLWQDVWNNFFGGGCGFECIGQLIATAPFYSSVAYSLGAWVALSKSKRSGERQTEPASEL